LGVGFLTFRRFPPRGGNLSGAYPGTCLNPAKEKKRAEFLSMRFFYLPLRPALGWK
jgi:hypothetical protein